MAGGSQVDFLPLLALKWMRDSVRSRGLLASVVYLGGQAWELTRDSLPDRRKSRFGDIDYDCDFGVDTTWARLPISVRLREVFTERLYQPTVPDEFSEIMQYLATVDFTSFTFIDLGSGKGRALLLAAMYPFEEIVGVEVQPELHRIAEQNIANFDVPGQQCRNVWSRCLDAREFEFPKTPIVLYLFNPFPDYVMEQVIAKLEASLRDNPRPTYVLYNAPWEKKVLEQANFLKNDLETAQYIIYEAVVSAKTSTESQQE
jgi:SAM-dependent methyltransferase